MRFPLTRLKNVASVRISSVDKKSTPTERPVRLCNYVDVYKRDELVPEMELMQATASDEQLRLFRVQPGDTLITKDSETRDDIAVPAFVRGATADMVCGYHLALVRPSPSLLPRYLFWVLCSADFRKQMTALATGVTRFGLRHEAIGNAEAPFPSLKEQRRIADFLDAEVSRIDALSRYRTEMKELLALRRERVIDRTLGLGSGMSPDAMVPLKYMSAGISVGIVITPAKLYVEEGGVPALRGINVKPGRISTENMARISLEGHADNLKSSLGAGDVVVVRTGQAGAAAVVPSELAGANCIDLLVIRPGPKLAPHYLEYVLNSEYARAQVAEHSVGSIQSHFNVGALKQLPIPKLPRDEQDAAVARLAELTGPIDELASKITCQQTVLSERRTALITAAVSGEFDVSTASGRGVLD